MFERVDKEKATKSATTFDLLDLMDLQNYFLTSVAFDRFAELFEL